MDFQPFPKVPRLSREIFVTEKIDGTNASVWITPSGPPNWPYLDEVLASVTHDGTKFDVRAGSRKRWITPKSDNFGFAAWVQDHAVELVEGLGEGVHHGEWWGAGIQRRYGLDHKRFSLFNAGRWLPPNYALQDRPGMDLAPDCCHVVPVLYQGKFCTHAIDSTLLRLRERGSAAAPGFEYPEGVMIYHVAANAYFKKTLEGDGHKGGG